MTKKQKLSQVLDACYAFKLHSISLTRMLLDSSWNNPYKHTIPKPIPVPIAMTVHVGGDRGSRKGRIGVRVNVTPALAGAVVAPAYGRIGPTMGIGVNRLEEIDEWITVAYQYGSQCSTNAMRRALM